MTGLYCSIDKAKQLVGRNATPMCLTTGYLGFRDGLKNAWFYHGKEALLMTGG
jgi:hypothetical protein